MSASSARVIWDVYTKYAQMVFLLSCATFMMLLFIPRIEHLMRGEVTEASTTVMVDFSIIPFCAIILSMCAGIYFDLNRRKYFVLRTDVSYRALREELNDHGVELYACGFLEADAKLIDAYFRTTRAADKRGSSPFSKSPFDYDFYQREAAELVRELQRKFTG